MSSTALLHYAPATARRGAPWWLWMLAALTCVAGFYIMFVPYKVGGRTTLARVAAARADVRQIRLALDAFNADTARYPTAAEGVGVLVNPPANPNNWHGPYLRRPPVDPWARPYVYSVRAGPAGPRVVSPAPTASSAPPTTSPPVMRRRRRFIQPPAP